MQSIAQPHVEHSIESAGVDWITATAQKGSTRWDMEVFARSERERLMDAGASIKQGYRLGYYGWQAEGFFHGQREGGSIIVASGAVAHGIHKSVANVSDNISRLDLQVTVSLPIERPNLAAQAHAIIRSGSPAKVRMKNVSYTNTSPQGDTCNIGKRKSDSYGRLYDKAAESGHGAARSRWRYEVELKRTLANSAASALRRFDSDQAVALSLVHGWFDARGVAPIFPPAQLSCPHEPSPAGVKRDVLAWFEQSLSITVQKAVIYYGLVRVLESLKLMDAVVRSGKEIEAYAERSRRPSAADSDLCLPRGELLELILGQGEADRPTDHIPSLHGQDNPRLRNRGDGSHEANHDDGHTVHRSRGDNAQPAGDGAEHKELHDRLWASSRRRPSSS
jgi:hypothetical protein